MKTFVTGMSSKPMWTELQHRMLPRDKWFGVDWRSTAWVPALPFRSKAQAVPAGTSPISTGSITPPTPEPAAPAAPEPK
jgi:hypothetical protein